MATAIDLRRTGGNPSEGTHVFKVIRATEEQGPKGPYWRLICQVQDGPDAGKESMLQIGLGQSTRWKMEEFLDAIQAPSQGSFRLEQTIGKVFRATIVLQPDRNDPNLKRVGFSSMIPYIGQLDFKVPSRPPQIEEEDDESDDDLPFDVSSEEESEKDEDDVF